MALSDHFGINNKVLITSIYPGTNGKVGTIARVDEYECDVKLGNFTFLIHKSQLEIQPD